ncbi:BQ5605_C003g02009 [Microbotryum silenes-dioicae]|uniref:BQ5605_C003g02009 protein n=1 Tax=Microbotryum silenes-dioicae TaxID=796604 RepID=A0A2X0MV43_9BASI|nr:BQ5605_C003g02009 [Microbotryum silenes-dioicae]
MRARNVAFIGNLFRSACLFTSQPLSLQLIDGWTTRSSVSLFEKTQRISKMATTTVDSGSATHCGLMGDMYGNVDATNWGTAKDRLQRVLEGDGRFKHVTTELSVGPKPKQSEFTRTLDGSTVAYVATFRTQHRNYRHDVNDLDQALAQARNILFAALDKDLGAASHDFARSAKLDALFQYQAYVDGDPLDPWLLRFNRLFIDLNTAHVSRDKAYQRAKIDGVNYTQAEFDKRIPPPALSEGIRMDLLKARMPRPIVTVIDTLGPIPLLSDVEGVIRCAAISRSSGTDVAEALTAKTQGRRRRPACSSGKLKSSFLLASKVPGLVDKWPHGVAQNGRLRLGPSQCRKCYEQGHLGDKSKHNISIGAADAMALVAEYGPDPLVDNKSYDNYSVDVALDTKVSALYLHDGPCYLLDSGAMCHMTTRWDLLIDFQPFTTEQVRVVGAFKSSAMAVGKGTLCFDTNGAPLELRNVLLVPGLSAKLVSLASLMKDGYQLSGICDAASEHSGLTVSGLALSLTFALDRDHYILQASPDSPPLADHQALTATSLPTDSSDISLDISAVTRDQLRLLDQCNACCSGKAVSAPSREAAHHPADAPFARVFADVWGPSPVPALSGIRYLCGITDEHSRFRWARGIWLKSEASSVLKGFVGDLAHGEGGFVNNALRDWLADRGIFHELSTAYEHGQMGIQERSWRTIFNSVWAWLHRSGLPSLLWEEAAQAAIYVINLLPSSPLQQRTPDAVLHAAASPVTSTRRPRIDHVKIWGCAAQVPFAPKQCSNKLAPRSCLCYFVGYSLRSKAWRFYDPVGNKVFESSQYSINSTTSAM